MTRIKRRASRPRSLVPLSLSPTHSVVLLTLALVGIVVSVLLTYVHHRLQVEPGWISACSINESIDCDAVVSSSYGSIAGIPLSLIAGWYYVIVAAVALVGWRGNPWRFPRSPALVLFLGATAASACSVALALISIVAIRSACLLCIALYVVNAAMLAFAWLAVRASGEGIRQSLVFERRYWENLPLKATSALFGAVICFGVLALSYISTFRTRSALCDAVNASRATQTQIEMVVFSDFQCPACRKLNRALRSLRHVPTLRIIDRHYPLDRSCNRNLLQTRHEGACLQARAALCATAQGQTVAYTDRLFDEGPFTEAALSELAETIGLDGIAFRACLASDDTAAQLGQSIADARAAGIRSTPTLFVNGRRHVGQLSGADLACLAGDGVEQQ